MGAIRSPNILSIVIKPCACLALKLLDKVLINGQQFRGLKDISWYIPDVEAHGNVDWHQRWLNLFPNRFTSRDVESAHSSFCGANRILLLRLSLAKALSNFAVIPFTICPESRAPGGKTFSADFCSSHYWPLSKISICANKRIAYHKLSGIHDELLRRDAVSEKHKYILDNVPDHNSSIPRSSMWPLTSICSLHLGSLALWSTDNTHR